MLKGLLNLFGSSSGRALKPLWKRVEESNALESELQTLSDDELRQKTQEFQERLKEGETLDDLLPETFAAVREAARRSIGLRHFDVQLIGGIVLHQGKIAEMATGEGKTLVATLPAYLNSLGGKGVHIVTVNDYLAGRDARWMGPVYAALGSTVGVLQQGGSFLVDATAPFEERLRPAHRREAYQADIIYGTNSEFGFDYLRDNMSLSKEQRVQRELHYAIVDEVDYILIDEARTPLIISGQSQESVQSYPRFAQVARRLRLDEDYLVDEKTRAVSLTDEGITKVEQALDTTDLYGPENYGMTHFVENALRAEAVFQRDKDYVVQDGQVILVDEFTGRLMPGRRYSDGLHQAIEAKEGVPVQRETVVMATITLQNYFRMYQRLAGMTGTAMTEADELWKIYQLDVVAIPTHRPMIRQNLPDAVYKSEKPKFAAVAEEVAQAHAAGRPVLLGTASIEVSERLSALLQARGIPHEVLNAKQHAKEAAIVAQAGRLGAVTVATNMAGRGTDIILGGSPAGRDPKEWEEEHNKVVELGGLYVIGTERHEARRIDNQLRGRTGRQGDPGSSRFYVSLEDELMRRFGGDRVKALMDWAGIPDETSIENPMVQKSLESAQVRVEGYNFEVRKNLVEFDDVINRHREVIYEERNKVLEGADLQSNIAEMIEREVRALVDTHLPGSRAEGWDLEGFLSAFQVLMPPAEWATPESLAEMDREAILEQALAHAQGIHAAKEESPGPEAMRDLERFIVLRTIDSQWVQHLTAMENMRTGIGLQAVGQRDPLVAYKQQGHEMFQELLERIRHDVVRLLLHVQVQVRAAVPAVSGRRGISSPMESQQRDSRGEVAGVGAPVRSPQKVGRNDPCPCGSGLKYKRCHGKAA